MTASGVEVSFAAIVKAFLLTAAQGGFETVVVAMPRGRVGGGTQMVASNTGSDGINKARTLLLLKGDAVIDRTAKAFHSFRFADAEGNIAPESNMCMYGPCLAAGCANTEWEQLPAEVQNAHRLMVQVLLGAAMSEPEPAPESKIVLPGVNG